MFHSELEGTMPVLRESGNIWPINVQQTGTGTSNRQYVCVKVLTLPVSNTPARITIYTAMLPVDFSGHLNACFRV
jgi:alpha-glucosidase (family GH31 glycosyl hydrolase)